MRARNLKSVWVLTSGRYSDYTIETVFATEEDALGAMALHPNRSWNPPREYVLGDTQGICPTGWIHGPVYTVEMKIDDGACERLTRDEASRPRNDRRCRVGVHPWSGEIKVWSPVGYEHAEKVAAETRQEVLRLMAQGFAGQDLYRDVDRSI